MANNGISSLPRDILSRALGGDLRAIRAFEAEAAMSEEAATRLASNIDATETINDATVLVLSANEAFANERVLQVGVGISAKDDGSTLTLFVNDQVPHVLGGFVLNLTATQDTQVQVPYRGLLATADQPETLFQKTLQAPMLSGVTEYATEEAAVAANLPAGTVYTVQGFLKLRQG